MEEPFSVEDILASVVRMMSSKVFASDIAIKTNVPPNIPDIYADIRLIRQVIINILTNAIKFSAKGSAIDVVAEKVEDGRLQIRISDHGIGIRKDKIAQALEPFGQVNDQPEHRDIRNQGTGLGLPLAKAMMELHGGRLTIQSELDVGTTVTLSFPKDRLIARKSLSSQQS